MRSGQPFARLVRTFITLLPALALAACGSTSVSQVSGPSDVRCATSLTANPQSVAADGGSVTIAVSTTRDCAWTSSSDASWIRLSTASGQGEASFTANVDANPQIVSRSGNVSVNGQRTQIVEAARPCTFSLEPPSSQFDGGGGTGHLAVTTIAGCAWRPTTTASWIQVPPSPATGSGGFDFHVAANDGGDRTGVISVADQEFVVRQSAAAPAPPGPPPAPNCAPTVAPLAIDVSAAVSTQTIQLVVGPTCVWTATSHAAWLTITSAAAGTGSAAITIAVAANTGQARSGTLTVDGQEVTIRQTALSCSFTLNPASQNFAAGGGSGRFTVNATAGCSWSASKGVPWIDLVQGTGTGTDDVTFSVQANASTTARTGTITVGGQTFTVQQAATACSYALSAASVNVSSDGGHNRVSVATASNCAWTAVAAEPWVEISNQSGTGSGDINFNVQPNPGTTARSTTITIGGQTVAINQAGVPCTYSISPASLNIAAGGSNGQFTVTTQAGCAWTAAPGAAWVTITSPQNGAGTGTGDVVYAVQPNPDPAARSTTISAGGQTHTVNQAAAAVTCTYTLDPPSASYMSAGGDGTFTITTQAGCSWTATTMESWMTVTTASGTGTGTVSYTVQPNATGTSRSGVITAGGQNFAVAETP